MTDGPDTSLQRKQTNESLRVERKQLDGLLEDNQHSDEQSVDRAVQNARASADAILLSSRESEDRRGEQALAVQVSATACIISERLLGDDALRHAGTEPDAAMSAAREQADQLLADAVQQAAASRTMTVNERQLEDDCLRDERAYEDRSLHRDRHQSALVLTRLLPLERARTDRHLLTERARSDAALSSRDDFLAIVSHDLRNLLGGIVMCSDLIAANAPFSPTCQQTTMETAHIQRYAARMNRLIGDLVDVVSLDAGKLAVNPVRGSSAATIREAVSLFSAEAAEKGITLQTTAVDDGLDVMSDSDRVLQVLANLFSNALKFTPRGGRIEARVERLGDEVVFAVEDTGCGIADNALTAVFDRFWQGRKDDRRGLGLGLYISRCIVEAHGGRIWARSVLGKGSTVSFTLPCSDSEALTPTHGVPATVRHIPDPTTAHTQLTSIANASLLA